MTRSPRPREEPPEGTALWDQHANWWKQHYTDGADPEYRAELFPLVANYLAGRERVLDLGCGEGQIARHLQTSGVQNVVGIDASMNQLVNANHRSRRAISYIQGAAEKLPFADASFDGIICCLAIEHFDDQDAALAEIARVLSPGGHVVLLVNHPIFQGPGAGFVDDLVLHECYWRIGPYLNEVTATEVVDVGVTIPFAHRPISRYINPLAERDVLLVEMLELPPLEQFIVDSVDIELERAIPRLLTMCFERRPPIQSTFVSTRTVR